MTADTYTGETTKGLWVYQCRYLQQSDRRSPSSSAWRSRTKLDGKELAYKNQKIGAIYTSFKPNLPSQISFPWWTCRLVKNKFAKNPCRWNKRTSIPSPWTVPYALRGRVNAEIDSLANFGIICQRTSGSLRLGSSDSPSSERRL